MYLLTTSIAKVRFLSETTSFRSFSSTMHLIFYKQNRRNKQFQGMQCNNSTNNNSLLIQTDMEKQKLISIRLETIRNLHSDRLSHLTKKKTPLHINVFLFKKDKNFVKIKPDIKRIVYVYKIILSLVVVLTVIYIITFKHNIVHLDTLHEPSLTATITDLPRFHLTERKDLPTYKRADVEQHNSLDKRIWITYGIGVYDITEFVPNHPGGEKILLGAGSAIDPFWAIYQQHNTIEILTLIEQYRIGNLNADEHTENDNLNSIWSNEPKRHPLLKAASQKPFNAEPPIEILADNFYTPNEFFYVRNHLPVPVIDEKNYELEIEIETDKSGTEKKLHTYKLSDIKALPKYSVTAAVMCGGNRRSEMTKVKSVKGKSHLDIFWYY